eukprot:11223089-Lingulodinium_polyedra.AAC.1
MGIAGTCGYAFPQKMWYRFPGLWKYKCPACWEPLVQEAQKKPEEKMPNEWVENLVKEYGDDIKQWPKVGCEANF